MDTNTPIAGISSDRRVQYFLDRRFSALERRRVLDLENLELDQLLQTQNPYFFLGKSTHTAPDIIGGLVNTHLCTQEEMIFGSMLGSLAIHVCGIARGGRASGIVGVDLEFEDDDRLYVISLKSGPNWGSPEQIRQMRIDFRRAYKILSQGNSGLRIQAIDGRCYGQTSEKHDRGDYWKLSGQRFWELISDDADFYAQIIEPLAIRAKTRNEEFHELYGATQNRLAAELIKRFARSDFKIDWLKIVEFNSESIV